jgi:Bardet-Biedl syndrome 9 protein
LDVNVVAAYTLPKGEPRTAVTDFRLPVCLACRVVAPLKNAQFVFTLDTNRDPPPLTELFEDILTTAINANPDIKRTAVNVMTVLYSNNVDVTVLVSKKAGRYRIQSGCFEALAMLTQELVLRMKTLYAKDGGDKFEISFKEALPLHDYFAVIDRHHMLRVRLQEQQV